MIRTFIHGVWGVHLARAQIDDAINELKLKSIAHPGDASALLCLGRAHWLKGMYKESQQELESEPRVDGKTEVHKIWLAGGESAVERWRSEY